MPNKIPKNISNRMPKKLPISKYINIIIKILQNKITIFNFIFIIYLKLILYINSNKFKIKYF